MPEALRLIAMPETKIQPWKAIWRPNQNVSTEAEGHKLRFKMPSNNAAHGYTIEDYEKDGDQAKESVKTEKM